MRIQQLPAFIANQIAAGEVIERPSSVVKELLENALDAGADTICIEIARGGLNQIKISDNGCGIVEEDLRLAISAHATSKIQQATDLYNITSMGFRGEALASIASVSRLYLYSRPKSQAHASLLQIVDGEEKLSPCARSFGTTVDVQDLFFNIPVRKKFLKTERSEYQAIELVVKRFALSVHDIALTLKHNDKVMLTIPAATCSQTRLLRIKKILGKAFLDEAIYLDNQYRGLHLSGWISRKDYQRSQRDKQWVYVNRRMIKDKLIHHAIMQAYQDILYPGRFSACLLYLNLPVNEVDVNVHPTKHEVRFQEPRLVHDFIISSITNALAKDAGDILTSLDISEIEPNLTSDELSKSHAFTEESATLAQYQNQSNQFVKDNLITKLNLPLFDNLDIQQNNVQLPTKLRNQDLSFKSYTGKIDNNQSSYICSDNWHILNSKFVIMDMNDKHPYLINLARVYQRYCYHILDRQNDLSVSRPLLVPVSFDIDKTNYVLFEKYQPLFMKLGIHFTFVSDNRILVRTIPQWLPLLNINELLQKVSQKLLSYEDLLKLVIECQSFDAYQVSIEEKALLMHYIRQESLLSHSYLRLDIETCVSLMSNA